MINTVAALPGIVATLPFKRFQSFQPSFVVLPRMETVSQCHSEARPKNLVFVKKCKMLRSAHHDISARFADCDTVSCAAEENCGGSLCVLGAFAVMIRFRRFEGLERLERLEHLERFEIEVEPPEGLER